MLREKQNVKTSNMKRIKAVIDENADISINRWNKMKIQEIWFDSYHVYGRDENGREYSQSLVWYPRMNAAPDEERTCYTFGLDGIHWRSLDEDISFWSFTYDEMPSPTIVCHLSR